MVRKMLLRLRPDWIVLGECRGDEAYYVARAMCIGHPAMTTFHADDARDAALFQFPMMLLMSKEGQAEGRPSALERAAKALDVVVHCAKVREGDRFSRRIVQVAEVLRKETPDGFRPMPRLVFAYEGGRLARVSDPEVFSKKKGWWR
jgi:pilus assembly protein CpaF